MSIAALAIADLRTDEAEVTAGAIAGESGVAKAFAIDVTKTELAGFDRRIS